MIRSGKRRLLSTFILALALVAQPFSALAGTAYAASDSYTGFEETLGDWAPFGEGSISQVTDTEDPYAVVNGSVFTRWGGYESIFPENGYGTSIDIYLDTEVAAANEGKHFDFSSASNNASGTHLRDFVFNVGASDGKWYVTANTGADAAAIINSETAGAVEVVTSGWYTFRTDFSNVEGQLVVSLSVFNRDVEGDEGFVGYWELSDPSDLIPSVVGGHRYGWFVNQQFSEGLKVDNAELTTYGPRYITNTTTGETFNTIQQALDDSDTENGDTIELEAGEYTENLTFNKAVSLIGPNAGMNPADGYRDEEAMLTGQITVFAGSVTIDGLTITNPDYSGASIKGVHVYGSGTGISDITVKNNIFTDITNGNSSKGSYGVLVQGAVSNVAVTDNTFEGITSQGWAHAVEVTPGTGVVLTPSAVTVTGNTFSGTDDLSGSDQHDFSVDVSGGVYANASNITFKNNRLSGVVRNLDPDHTLDATANWWGEGTAVSGPAASRYEGKMIVSPWCADVDCVDTYSTPGEAVQLVVNEGSATTSTFLSLSPAGQPSVTALIPQGTTITSSDLDWDGTIQAPEISTYNVPGSGSTALVFSVGSSEHSLALSQAAQLRFPGQAGKKVGYLAPESGSVFTEITTVCDANDPGAADAQLGSVGACKIDDGADLVVWTKHFTMFATYVPQTVSQNNTSASSSTSSVSHGRSTSFFGVNTYDESWMEGAAGLQSAGEVKSNNAGVSSTSTFAKATNKDIPAQGMAWYWWLLGAAVLAGAWPAYNALRARYFNR